MTQNVTDYLSLTWLTLTREQFDNVLIHVNNIKPTKTSLICVRVCVKHKEIHYI